MISMLLQQTDTFCTGIKTVDRLRDGIMSITNDWNIRAFGT